MSALLQSVSNSGYQLVVTAGTPQPVKDQVRHLDNMYLQSDTYSLSPFSYTCVLQLCICTCRVL